MPRRSGGGRSSFSRPVARPPPPVQRAPAPVPAQPQSAMMQPQQKQPGMMAQMATTAAGVAVGSAVGHVVAGSIMGGGGGGHQEAAPAPAPQQQPAQYDYQTQQPMSQGPQAGGACGLELKQFIECTQGQADISLCQGFNEVLRECRLRHGMQFQ